MFGGTSSNNLGAGIRSGGVGMSMECEFSGVGSCTYTGNPVWSFWSVAVPRDVPSKWISSVQIFTSANLTQSQPDRRVGFICICSSLKIVRRWQPAVVSAGNSVYPLMWV